jgi:deoxyadenosine/deoxycytidine kinase
MRIAIEANIGAGKSTLLQSLMESFPDLPIHPEPVDEWGEWLPLFYGNKSRWGFSFQMQVLLSYLRGTFEPDCVMERCAYSCRYVFGQSLYSDGFISEKEWQLFKEYYDEFGWNPDAIIYIRATPEVCHQRIQKRARPGESDITIDYLKKIDFQYENLNRYFQDKVFIVDGNQSAEKVFKDVSSILERLHERKEM